MIAPGLGFCETTRPRSERLERTRRTRPTEQCAARILRFERAAHFVRAARPATLSRIANESGYHDQAHMTREFRVLAGITPAVYRVGALPGYLGIPDAACAQPRLG